MTNSLLEHTISNERRALRRIVGDRAKRGSEAFKQVVLQYSDTLSSYAKNPDNNPPGLNIADLKAEYLMTNFAMAESTVASFIYLSFNTANDTTNTLAVALSAYTIKLALAYLFIKSNKSVKNAVHNFSTDKIKAVYKRCVGTDGTRYLLSPEALIEEFNTMCSIAKGITYDIK